MNPSLNRCATAVMTALLTLALVPAGAQAPAPAAAPAAAPDAAAPAGKQFSQEQLDQMLASIALYPDALLSQVLMASTYPLEIVEAARWSEVNKGLKGAALEDALKGQSWDESVKSLTAFPDVLTRMNKDLSWTQNLGDAFLGQQEKVMATVQGLRQKAQTAGNLQTNEQQKVVVENKYITIEPANPQVVYVPTYNPTVVYGGWWWPSYPPYYPPYWYPPVATPLVRGFAWGVGVAAGAALWGGFNWNNNDVNINVNKYNNFNKTNISNGNWNHKAEHRNGVPYRDNGARQKYGGSDMKAAQSRDQFRGRQDSLGGSGLNDRAGLQDAQNRGSGNRAGTNDFGASNRAGDRGGAGAGDRGGGGARPDLGVSAGGQGERYGGGGNNNVGNRGNSAGGGFGSGGSGAQTREASNRGNASMGNRSSSSMSRGGGGGGGGRGGGGGGGGRGGGGRR